MKSPSAEQPMIKMEMNQCIRDFIEKLPESYKSVVVLSELEGLKNREIADILGVSVDTVKIRLHRARAKLKKELESHCDFYRDKRNVLECDLKGAFDDYEEAPMENRIKELIAIGASITANCKPCLEYHVAEAIKSGAGEQEIAEAIAVAKMVRKGALDKMDQFTSGILQSDKATPECSENRSECS
ncbi:sigma-70 family RNA polymerase sigma factor [Gemmatimonadota bacterium]